MEQADRSLRRLLRKREVAGYLAQEFERLGGNHTILDLQGTAVLGQPREIFGDGAEILVDGRTIGHVHGPRAPDLAQLLQLLSVQESETRALARESLDRYRELAILYSVSDKVIRARHASDIAQVVCREAMQFLDCDGVTTLLLNPEVQRLELAAGEGAPLQNRSTREIGNDIVASVLRSGNGEIVNDVAADPRSLDTATPVASLICSPLKSNERVFGVVVAGSEAPREFKASDLQILSAIAAHAAAAVEVARLDRDLKAISRKPVELIYGVNEFPPFGVSLILGLQHVLIALMSLAYPVLVTLEAGGSREQAASVVSMSLIAMAIATVLQIWQRGAVGSGYLVPYITSAIYLGPSILAARIGGLPLVFGMTMFAGAIALALSQLLQRFRKLFPPEVSGVVVLMVGLSIVPVALSQFLGIGGGDTESEAREWIVGLLTLGTILLASVLRIGKLRLYATAIGIGVGYLAAAFFGFFNSAMLEPIRDLPIVGLQALHWHGLAFDALLVVPFVAAALAANAKDAGLVISCQKANDAGWKRPDMRSVGGGLVAGGIGNIASGALGGLGLSISAGSVGLSIATGATSRIIGLAAAALLLALAFLPKATALLAIIPAPIMGAGLIYIACHLIASGTELIASRMLDSRRIYVIGLPLLAGVGLMALPDLFGSVPGWAEAVVASPLAAATILALVLNLAMNAGVSSRATTHIDFEGMMADAVLRFLERQGAIWGARSDVIGRAVPAVTESCEELHEITGATSALVELSYDETRLVATLRLPTQHIPDAQRSISHGEYSLETTASTIARRYDCQCRLLPEGGLVIAFEA